MLESKIENNGNICPDSKFKFSIKGLVYLLEDNRKKKYIKIYQYIRLFVAQYHDITCDWRLHYES